MNSTIARNAAATIIAAAMFSSGALAQGVGVSVVVNGQAMTFDQPPVEQAGRVFVPLRGIFERLGASVVYQNGTINATGNGRTVSLKIGSTSANVNGQDETLDSPPFVTGSRTLVPLRFVAQALGANVDWNNDTSTVTISGSGYHGGAGSGNGYNNGNGNGYSLRTDQFLAQYRPNDGAAWAGDAIRAQFVAPIRPDSIRIVLDGNDVTAYTSITRAGFSLPVHNQLQTGLHRVRVSGEMLDGTHFSTGWDFHV